MGYRAAARDSGSTKVTTRGYRLVSTNPCGRVDPGRSKRDSLLAMRTVITSASGDAQTVVEQSASLSAGDAAADATITIDSSSSRQTVFGIGSSLTQASAAALSRLRPEQRQRVLELAFGPEGAGFSMVRTHIASCDFSTSSYTYAPAEDPELADFSIDVDRDNGHLDLIRDAIAVPGADFRIIASPWTAPPWMKDNGRFFEPEARRGGALLEHHYETFARYIARYIEAYADAGAPTWAVTPVNEPHGNGGTWESMEMTPEQQRAFVRTLGPVLRERGHDARILIFDQNRKGMKEYADVVFGDAEAAPHAFGTAVHWYDSTFRVFENELDELHAAWPDRPILQTEACIDNVFGKGKDRGPDAPTPWWRSDRWFWRQEATDWGWDWLPEPFVDHPPYVAAFRYARDLVGGLGHWLSGWVDWNLVLDRRGGPNHVGNFCLAPILVDDEDVYVTPLFHILAQVSRYTRPGATVVEASVDGASGLWAAALQGPEGGRAVHVFNESHTEMEVDLGWDGQAMRVESPPASLLTVVLEP